MDGVAPQDLANGECASGGRCGFTKADDKDILSAAFQETAKVARSDAPLSAHDFQVLASLDEHAVDSDKISQAVVEDMRKDSEADSIDGVDDFKRALMESDLL